MFRKLLEKLTTEYAGQPSYMGGDLEADLESVGRLPLTPRCRKSAPPQVGLPVDTFLWRGYIRALYDLGVLVALEPPDDGEVVVDVKLARSILSLVLDRRIETLRVCCACETAVGPDATRFKRPVGATRLPSGELERVWELAAFCPDCAAKAGPEWMKP